MKAEEARKVALEIICNREHLVNFPFDYKKGLANEIADAIIKDKKKPQGSKIKICAACGGFAHGNPGHDISI